MRSILIFALFFIAHLGYSHDIRMAIFEISETDSGYYLEISFDKEDLIKSLSSALGKGETPELIEHYLESNFEMIFDGNCISPQGFNIKYEEEYIRVKCSLPLMTKNVQSIKVYNTCLLDNEGHMNIIKSKLHGRTRTFRMTNERIRTVIDYKE